MGLFDFFKKDDERKEVEKTIFYYKSPSDAIKSDIGGREGQIITAQVQPKSIHNHTYNFIDAFYVGSPGWHQLAMNTDYNIHMGYFVEDINSGGITRTIFKSVADCLDHISTPPSSYLQLGGKNNTILIHKVPSSSCNVRMLKNSDELFFPELLSAGVSPVFINSRYEICKSNGYYYFLREDTSTQNSWDYRFDKIGGPKIFYGFIITDSNDNVIMKQIEMLNSMDMQKINVISKVDGLYDDNEDGVRYIKNSFFGRNADDYSVFNLPRSQNYMTYSENKFFIFKKDELVVKNLNEVIDSMRSDRIRINRDNKLKSLGI